MARVWACSLDNESPIAITVVSRVVYLYEIQSILAESSFFDPVFWIASTVRQKLLPPASQNYLNLANNNYSEQI